MPNRPPVAFSQTVNQSVSHLLEWLESETDPRQRIIVGMAGLPGSGKSTIATQLADAVNAQTSPGTMVALGMDGFHLTKAQLAQFADPVAALTRRGSPWTFDPQALGERLKDLRGGVAVSWPGFEHGVGDPVPDAVQVEPSTRLVLIEGLYLLHTGHGWDLADQFDERWFLDVPMDVAMNRLIARHMRANGHSREVAEARLAVNDRLNAEIVWPSRASAQWLVANPD
jgi:pantothenate kinase